MLARDLLLVGLLVTCLWFSQQPVMAGPGELVTVTYPVGDVIIPINVDGPSSTTSRVTASLSPSFEANLVHAIINSIDPASWAAVGGQCTIQYCKDKMSLVVVQTQANQERIADLLAAMRRFNALEVALEVRMLTVPESVLQHLSSECGIKFTSLPSPNPPVGARPAPPVVPVPAPIQALVPAQQSREALSRDGRPVPEPATNLGFVDHDQLVRLLKAIEPDRRVRLCAVPKMTVFNGQAGTMSVQDNRFFLTKINDVVGEDGEVYRVPVQEPVKVGFEMTARPVVSADRRFVRLALDMKSAEIAGELPSIPVMLTNTRKGKKAEPAAVHTVLLQRPVINVQLVTTTFSIPDGGTAIFCGPVTKASSHAEADCTVMGKIPYVNRLFTNVAYDPEPARVLFMVTPRIIINDESVAPPAVAAKGVPQPSCVPPAQTGGIAPAVWSAPPVLPQPMPPVPCRTANLVSDLLKAYDEACAAGHAEEAERLARAALALDATCFQKRK